MLLCTQASAHASAEEVEEVGMYCMLRMLRQLQHLVHSLEADAVIQLLNQSNTL